MFKEALEYTTKENKNAVITVGIVKNGNISYKVYGENGEVRPSKIHTYEIGSLTKTLTSALISKAIDEGKISFDDTIDKYLDLPEGKHYQRQCNCLHIHQDIKHIISSHL